MNYLKQINGFWIWRKLNTLSHAQMDLYFAILDCANTALWKKDFSVPNSTLMNLCQLSKTQLFNARNQLIQLGLIGYTAGKKGQSGRYSIVPLYQTYSDTDGKTNFKPIFDNSFGNTNKEKEKENINKNIFKENYKNNFSYAVFTDDYDHDSLEALTRKS